MKIFPIYVSLLTLMLYLFTVDVIWASYLAQMLYWLVILIVTWYLWIYWSEYKRSYIKTLLLVIIYIIFLSSWSIPFFKYSISPDVIYKNQIIEDIVILGHMGPPDSYYYATKLYAEWPLLEIMVAMLSIITSIESLIITKYLWIGFKILLVACSLILFREILRREFGDEVLQNNLSEAVLYAILIFLASSSSIYFYSFTVKSLLSITYVLLYFTLIYKGNVMAAIIVGFAIGLSHSATTYVLAFATISWLIVATLTRDDKRESSGNTMYRLSLFLAIVLTIVILWKARLNLQNTAKTILEAFTFLGQPQIERGLEASISPIKPLIYKVLGHLGEFTLIVLFISNAKKAVYKFLKSLNDRTPLSLLMLFCLIYVLGITTLTFIIGQGVDIIVRVLFYLNLAIAPYVSPLLLKLKNSYLKLHKAVLSIILILFLATGLYGIIPPAVYDKNVAWGMDDPRFYLHYGDSLWHVGDYIISHKPSYTIFSIALGYYFLGGREIPYTSLCGIGNYKNTALILLRRSIEWLPDYCGIALNLSILYRESSVVYHSGEIFLILK